jgi:hypothetical protein
MADSFAAAGGDVKGYLGHAFGLVVEEIEKEEGSGKGKAVVLCIGWESRDAHMAFRETETFAKNIHLLREGMKGAEMVSCPVLVRSGLVSGWLLTG